MRVNLSVLSREHSLYAGIIEDINQRKQAEAERASALAQLRDKSNFLARAQTVAKLGTFEVDTRARTVAISAEFARMLAAGDEPFELPLDEYRATFVHPDDREWSTRLVEDAYRRGAPVSWERRLIRRNGEVFWEASHAGFERDVHDQPDRMMGVVQDITDRVGLVEDLRGSRARIVEAGARERLRLERDLHDGAQNRLVAIQIKLGLARDQAGAGAVATPPRRDHRRRRGGDRGAAGARARHLPNVAAYGRSRSGARSLARAAPVRVHAAMDAVGRHAPTVEEAVFFCVREAIQNAAKHAGAGAHVTLAIKRRERGSSSRSATTDLASIHASSRMDSASRACATASPPSAASSRSAPHPARERAFARPCRRALREAAPNAGRIASGSARRSRRTEQDDHADDGADDAPEIEDVGVADPGPTVKMR